MILYYCHVSGLTSGACVVGPGVALGFIGALLTPSGQVTWKCDTILPTLYSEEGRNAKICVQETWYKNCFVVFYYYYLLSHLRCIKIQIDVVKVTSVLDIMDSMP